VRGKVPLHYGYEAFGVQDVVTYSSGVPAAVLGPVWPVWGSMLGEMSTHAASKRASDTGWISPESTHPMRQMRTFAEGQAEPRSEGSPTDRAEANR